MNKNKYSIRDYCTISENDRDVDSFVGISCCDGVLRFVFPMGFGELPKEDKELRKDILKVIKSISFLKKDRHYKSTVPVEDSIIETDNFPIVSYLYIISDYLENGYFKEKESNYSVCKKGKIHWGKTIKTQKPYQSNGNLVYLNYVVRKSTINENELISQIHKYCVYESFERIGWLFTGVMPEKPELEFNEKCKNHYLSVIASKLDQTFNDGIRLLLSHMKNIIEGKSVITKSRNFTYGTNRYEYVWEKAVDIVFGFTESANGELEKKDFFPQTFWRINGNEKDSENSYLRPDSIMIYNNDIFILDAKYYKYGLVRNREDLQKPPEQYLPKSADINKQITYGEYVASKTELKKIYGDYKVYNAFLMPFNSDAEKYENIGSAYSDWKHNSKEYEHVQGILVDLRHLIDLEISHNQTEIDLLAEAIMNGFKNE